MLALYDVVRLREDDPAHGVKKSYKGAIVDILAGGEAYTVEFFNDDDETIEDALFTEYTEDQLERIS